MGLAAFINTWFFLPESLPASERQPLRPAAIVKTYVRLITDRDFMLPALSLSAAFFFLFVYIGGASIVYQTSYKLSPEIFGLVFGGTGIAVLLGAIAAGRWVNGCSVPQLARCGTLIMAGGAAIAYFCGALDFGFCGYRHVYRHIWPGYCRSNPDVYDDVNTENCFRLCGSCTGRPAAGSFCCRNFSRRLSLRVRKCTLAEFPGALCICSRCSNAEPHSMGKR